MVDHNRTSRDQGTRTRKGKVAGKLVQERVTLVSADPEFARIRRLVPRALRGKEFGKDFDTVTADSAPLERNKQEGTIILSANDWKKYEAFQCLCQKLAAQYKLHWATVEDLAMGIKSPKVAAKAWPRITALIFPMVLAPKEFDPRKYYAANESTVPPLHAREIMSRVKQLAPETQQEIKHYLSSLFHDKFGCRVVELREASAHQESDKISLDVHLTVPSGYTAEEVGEAYRKVDQKRREIMSAVGMPMPLRRRQSKTLMNAKKLKLQKDHVPIYEIVDKVFPQDEDGSRDQVRRKAIINKRYSGKRLRTKHLA